MNKKITSLVLVVLLILSSFSFAFAQDVETTKITIIHTNDTHARIEEDDYNGIMGFAKIATLINEAKEENPNTLIFDAGDTLHGLPIVNISKGENALKVLEAAGFELMVPGNHDFNYGYERLLELKDISKVQMINANIFKGEENLFTPYVIKEVGGVKIGVFGLTTPETAYKTSPSNVKGLTFKDSIEVAKDMVEELKDKVDVIIALTHVGLDESSVVTTKQIAENVEGIDVIIDGHSHTLLNEGLLVNDTLIAQTGEHDKNLGYINIEVKDGKVVSKKAELLSSEKAKEVEADADLTKLMDEIKAANELVFSEVVAKTDIFLDGARENVRTKETNLGNLSADAVRAASGADIGFVNGGNIRISIEPGDITFGDVATLFPFGNTIKVQKITGKVLLEVLEQSVSGYPATQGGFLQVSGMEFSFDPAKEVGARVVEVKIGTEALDENAEYTIAINDFMAEGGDDYTMLVDQPIVAEVGTYEEVFAEYLNTNGTEGIEVSGRIKVLEEVVEEPAPVEPEPEVVEPEPVEPEIVEPEIVEPEPAEEVTYIVIPGDVLWKIAAQYNLTYQELAEYNNLANPHLIYVDQVLKVPSK